MGTLEFFPQSALAVHLYVEDTDGIVKLLLLPPVGCNTLKKNRESLFMGREKTQQISRNILSSLIEESRRIFPINLFFPKNSRIPGPQGILMFPFPLRSDEGKHMISRS